MSQGVGGIQMADVSVDTETGIVKMNKFVAVQDCGLIINPRLAESQIHGAVIMGICAALFEERVMDRRSAPNRVFGARRGRAPRECRISPPSKTAPPDMARGR